MTGARIRPWARVQWRPLRGGWEARLDATLVWIVAGGLAMAGLALVGAVTLVLKESTLQKILLPLVSLSAGSLLGGALFHMLPESVEHMENRISVWIWVATGFGIFLLLEQFLQWHHCHRPTSEHDKPVTYMVLIADGVHNLIGGLAVGGAFLVDTAAGISAWVAAAAHEVPQELGDFGVLVHSGWSKKKALLWNMASALTFLVGGLIAYAVSTKVEVDFLLPVAAGNFIYIAAADLVPEIKRHQSLRVNFTHFLFFNIGMGVLLALRLLLEHQH